MQYNKNRFLAIQVRYLSILLALISMVLPAKDLTLEKVAKEVNGKSASSNNHAAEQRRRDPATIGSRPEKKPQFEHRDAPAYRTQRYPASSNNSKATVFMRTTCIDRFGRVLIPEHPQFDQCLNNGLFQDRPSIYDRRNRKQLQLGLQFNF